MTMDHREIPLSKISTNPDQPRQRFDADDLAELAASVEANGLLEPIVVRPTDDPAGFVIVAGERRFRACQNIGLQAIAATVIDISEPLAFMLSVAENLNRADMTVMEEARAFGRLRRYGRDVSEISTALGKSTAFIQGRLTLLGLIDEAARLVESGTMGPMLGVNIAALGPQNQRTVTNRWARGEFPDQTAASEFARALRQHETAAGFFDLQEPTLAERRTTSKRRNDVRSSLDSIERALTALESVASVDPAVLAALLGPESGMRMRQAERIERLARRTVANLRRARAASAADSLRTSEGVAGER